MGGSFFSSSSADRSCRDERSVVSLSLFAVSCLLVPAVLADSLVKAALHSGVIVAFIGAVEFLSVRCALAGASLAFSEAARWTLWVGTVFASGVIAAGPKKWLEQSQLISALKVDDVIVGKDWWVNERRLSFFDAVDVVFWRLPVHVA